MLARLGLIDAAGDATDQGRRALSALEQGNARQYRAAVQDARARLQREAATAQRTRDREAATARREQDKRDREATREAEQAKRDGRVREDRGGTRQRRIRLRDLMPKRKSFQVFKGARGRRWVAFSSTAYRDRDGEIVSTKALRDDVARADATGVYGPLRWWHVPGLDLGDCDFNALSGRVLIESGTFRTERIARLVAAKSADLEISLGFLHPPSDPDAGGVFHTIRRFERSLTPRGKASNLFTNFRVKEPAMALDATKRAALKALGFGDDDITQLETQAAATEKAADAAGVAFKAVGDAPLEEVTIGGVTYTLAVKAPPPPADEPAVEVEAEIPMDDGMLDEDTGGGLTLSPEDIGAIGQAFQEALTQALAPLMGLLDIEKKMATHVQTVMGGYSAQKDSADAEQRQQLTTLTQTVQAQGAQLADLAGTQPAAVVSRPSAAQSTVVSADDPLVQQTVKAAAEQHYTHPFGDIQAKLFGNGQPPAN
jgi:hypothetical protein